MFYLHMSDPGLYPKNFSFESDSNQVETLKKIEEELKTDQSYTSAILKLDRQTIATYDRELGSKIWVRYTRISNIHPLYYKSTIPTKEDL